MYLNGDIVKFVTYECVIMKTLKFESDFGILFKFSIILPTLVVELILNIFSLAFIAHPNAVAMINFNIRIILALGTLLIETTG